MSILNEDFFDDENVMKDVSSDEEQKDTFLEKQNYWYILNLDCSYIKTNSLTKEDFKKKWSKMFKAVPSVLEINDFIENYSDIEGYLIHVDNDKKKPDYRKNNYRLKEIDEIYSSFIKKKFIKIYIVCNGFTFYKLRDEKIVKGIENITKWFVKCLNNIGLKDVKSSFWITFDNQDYYNNCQISVDSLPESSFNKIKFVDSMINKTVDFCGDEYTAKKQFGKSELSILGNSYTIRLYRMVRNICITGEEENVKTYYINNGNISNVADLCEEEDLINKSKETTNKLIQLILNSINSKKYSIRPFYIKYPDETLCSIFSLNLVAAIDDERYLVHIEKNYPRPGAGDTLPLSLDGQNAEITEKYISRTRLITGSSEFEQFMIDDHSVPNDWKF